MANIRNEIGDYKRNREQSSTDALIARLARVESGPEIVELKKTNGPLSDRIEAIIANDPRTAPHEDVVLEDGTIVDQKAYLARQMYQSALEEEQKKRNSVDYKRMLEARLQTMNIDPNYSYSHEYVRTEGEE